MNIKWTSKALDDVARLYDFLASVNPQAAAKTVQSLTKAPNRLQNQPRIGEQLEEFSPLEVRHIFVGHYEMRYEIRENIVYIIRIWHTREDR